MLKGKQSILFDNAPYIISSGSIVGKKVITAKTIVKNTILVFAKVIYINRLIILEEKRICKRLD